jgi:NAD(P)-dependent dehydrogenase (short-subunit alcohol dehydrogenase family)
MEPLPQTPSFRLDGKRALVTGAGRGIGVAMAAALASAGAAVTLCARTDAEIEAMADAIRDAGGQADSLALDVCDEAAAAKALDALPAFDIVVNNAGTNRPKPFLEVSPDDYDAVIDVNLRAVFFLTQAATRKMIEAGVAGSIINMSSQMGHVGAARRSIYCASKAGLEGLTKALAIELAPSRIRVNAIAPTFIETPMTKPFFSDEAFRKEVLSKIKLGRLGSVQDLMGAVVFLASDASALMTGTSLVIDGGWTAE